MGAEQEIQEETASLKYAPVANRMITFCLDLLLALILLLVIRDSISFVPEDPAWARQVFFLAWMILYFYGFSVSPLKTTPVKRLLRIYVVRDDGEPVRHWQFLLRAVLVLATFYVCVHSFKAVYSEDNAWWAGIALVLILIPVFTRRYQGLHDLLLGAVVVEVPRKAPLSSVKLDARLIKTAGWDRSRWFELAKNLIVLFLVTVVLNAMVEQQHLRDRVYRVAYAMNTAREQLQPRVEAFYREQGRFPRDEDEMEPAGRIAYPDGGGCRIGAEGHIRIWFNVLPDLKKGFIELIPALDDTGEIEWRCRVEGKSLRRYAGSCEAG